MTFWILMVTLIKEVRTGLVDENDSGQAYSITYELKDGKWVMTDKEKINMEG